MLTTKSTSSKQISPKLLVKISELDRQAMLWVSKKRSTTLTYILKAFSYSGTTKFWFGLAFVLSVLYVQGIHLIPEERVFLRALFAPFIAWLAGKVIKRVINRKRPYESIDGFQSLVTHPSCESFPSVHAASTASFAMCLILLGHPWAVLIVLWTLFVSASRYYLGVHYPSDLLAGIALGLLSGVAVAHFIA